VTGSQGTRPAPTAGDLQAHVSQQLKTQVATYTAGALVWLLLSLAAFGLLSSLHSWPWFLMGCVTLGLASYCWWRARLSAALMKTIH
jgi:hypothetical protein